MSEGAIFTEVRSSIPVMDLSLLESWDGKTYDELVALVPEINVMEVRNETAAR